jgi:hypothetical protein
MSIKEIAQFNAAYKKLAKRYGWVSGGGRANFGRMRGKTKDATDA